MKEPKVVIIGGGLSAIYSYFGALDAGFRSSEIEILVHKIEPLSGAIFMYSSPIEWNKIQVTNILMGTCDEYSRKQWQSIQKTSAHSRFFSGHSPVVHEYLYDPSGLYSTLWSLIPRVTKIGIMEEEDLDMMKERSVAVICTFPNEKIRSDFNPAYFMRIPIYSQTNISNSNNYTVIYNGQENIPWVRKTIFPGTTHTEYPFYISQDKILDFEEDRFCNPLESQLVYRPDLHPHTPPLKWEERIEGNLFRVGRQAVFDPKYLSNKAQEDTRKFLETLK